MMNSKIKMIIFTILVVSIKQEELDLQTFLNEGILEQKETIKEQLQLNSTLSDKRKHKKQQSQTADEEIAENSNPFETGQDISIEKTKIDMGELQPSSEQQQQSGTKQNGDLQKLMSKFQEDSGLVILNQNIKMDTGHLEDLQNRIDSMVSTNQQKEMDLKNLQEREKVLQQEVVQISQDNNSNELKLGQQQQKKEEKEYEEDQVEQQNKQMQDVLQSNRKIHEKLKKSLENNDNQQQKIESENKQLEKDISQLESEKQKINEVVESEKKRGDDSRQEQQNSQDRFDQLTEMIRNIRKNHEEMTEELEDLNEKNKQQSLELVQLQDNQREYEVQLDGKRAEKKQVETNVAFMKRMMKNLEKDGEMVEGQKREMEDRLAGLDYEIKKSKSEYEMTKSEQLNRMEEYKIQLQSEKKKLQEEFQAELALEGKQKERIDKLRAIDNKLQNQRVFLQK